MLSHFFRQDYAIRRGQVVLKYVVLSSMLALSGINPFDSREAKVRAAGSVAVWTSWHTSVDGSQFLIFREIVSAEQEHEQQRR